MKTAAICSAGLIGTSLMTAFSYGISKATHQQFREPQLLAKLLSRLFSQQRNPKHDVHGWLLHYSIGLIFTTVYDLLWRKTSLNPSMAHGALLGGISGVIGAEVWKLVLKTHPDPPNVNLKEYYRQLLAAHVVFGIFAAAGYRLEAGVSPQKHSMVGASKKTAMDADLTFEVG